MMLDVLRNVYALRSETSRTEIGTGRNFRLSSVMTVVTVEDSLLLSANTTENTAFACRLKKKRTIALLRKREDFTTPRTYHSYHHWCIILCCSFLVSASSHTWSFSWIAQNTARLNTNREIRPYSLRTIRYC